MKNSILLISLSFILLFACSDNDVIQTIEPHAGINSVNLSAPAETQQSKYVRYTGNCSDASADISFTGDTLVLTVERQGSDVTFIETFTESSPLRAENPGIEPVRYSYELKEGYGLLKERFGSALFFFYGNDTLFFEGKEKISLYQNACQLAFDEGEVFDGEEIGILDDFRIGNIRVRNRDAVSCVPLIFELDAYLMYDNESLAMSHTIAGSEISGWLQIE